MMNENMKKKGMNMMEECKDMMSKMDPEMKQKCQSMMDRGKKMMSDAKSKQAMQSESLIYTHKASLSFEEIGTRVEDDAKAIGLELKKVYPFSKNLPELQGFAVEHPASVYELCLPSLAADLLNTQPELNVLMPCRISLYEKNSEVFVSTPNLVMQLDALGCEEALKEQILELYGKILEMIQAW